MRMTPISWPVAGAALLSLAACSSSGTPPTDGQSAAPVPPAAGQIVSSGQPPRNLCNAQAAQSWVGQPYGATTLAQALAAAGADEARMLRPDSAITREYKVGRLNVVVEADNRISRVHCG